ncbi:MAG: PLP-dependent aminotransferase family protein [Dehalococcoidia bacterium]
MRTAFDPDLPIHLERGADRSLEGQLAEQLRCAILEGKLAAGARLPSTRALATVLGVSRNVPVAAYDELVGEGYLEGRQGSGSYVAADLQAPVRPPPAAPASSRRWLRPLQATASDDLAPVSRVSGVIEFQLGRTVVAPLSLDIWRQVWRDVIAEPPPADYGPPSGYPELQTAIAGYLGRARGLGCAADDVIITEGSIQALDLIVQATLLPEDTVGFEEPGYPLARQVLQARGVRLVPLPVDDDGLRVDSLPCGPSAPLVVYTTPSHQYPLGGRLSIARRLALLDWARANDSLIIEDDYDGEFRFDAPPLPALAGLDKSGRVAYVGTFSKVLTPVLRVGYLVGPASLRERVERLKRLADQHTPWLVQRALATFISSGHLERHIRRMRREYAAKRAALHQAFAPVGRLAQLRGLDAGLHAYLELRADLDPRQIARTARERGVIVSRLDRYYLGAPDRCGLLLGYGGVELADVGRGGRILAEVIGAADLSGV